ncbi:hypothetical protein [Nocardioides sp. WS12]|uniref:hypothetical protein n=1 Tax=Nocardioides sp. WS12 TaxID=2486272 RepID=UPI0015FD2C04|nr:hypothetical protein [Nocardioides sp. WS12]
MPPVPSHEDPVRTVDPDLFHGRVIEERLERSESGNARDEFRDECLGMRDRSDDARQAELVVDAHEVSGVASYGGYLALRIDPVASYDGAQLLIEACDHVVGRWRRHDRWLKQGHGGSPR